MARARNIKPSLFKNEILGVEDPMLTLLFISLWCLADKRGRLEDRPLRIKAETFPYRENLDINRYLTELERLGFIQRYSVENVAIIQVVNFNKHQNPHKTEKESELPEYNEKSDSCSLTVKEPLNNGSCRADSGFLIPDSLNTDSLNTEEPEKSKPKKSKVPEFMSDVTEQTYSDFKELRKAKRAPITATVIKVIRDEAEKANITLEKALIECCARGWQGFNADWLNKSPPSQKNQKFDPIAYVNRNRINKDDEQNHRIIDIQQS